MSKGDTQESSPSGSAQLRFFILKCHFLILSKLHANLLNGGNQRWAPKMADHTISTITIFSRLGPKVLGNWVVNIRTYGTMRTPRRGLPFPMCYSLGLSKFAKVIACANRGKDKGKPGIQSCKSRKVTTNLQQGQL